jgi:hypothetical protein
MGPQETPPHLPKVRDDIALVEIDGEAIIFDPAQSRLHHLNVTAAIIFQLCDGTGTTGELAADIAEVSGAPLDQVEREVGDVVARFGEMGILVGSEKEGPDG